MKTVFNIRKIAFKCKVKRFFPGRPERKAFLLFVVAVSPLVPLLVGPSPCRAGEVVLQVANWGGAEEVKLEEEIARRFMEEHPGVRVEIETIPSGYKEKILTRIASGKPPDVFLLDSTILPAFLNRSLLVDLMPYLRRYGPKPEAFFPNVFRIAMRDSQLFAIPKDFNSLMVFYNKDLFDRAGIPYPQTGWTWDDFLRITRQLTRDTNGDGLPDQFGTALSTRFYLWQPWLWVAGGDLLSPDGTHATGYFNSPASLRAVQFLVDLKRKYHVTPEAISGGGMMTSLFFTGKVATMVNGHWMVITIRKYLDSGELRIGAVHIPIPPGGHRATVMYESGWCVPVAAPHRELAIRLALFLGGEYAARVRSRSGIAIPAIRKVAEEQLRRDPWGIEKAFYDEIPYCRQPWGTRILEFRRLEQIAEDAMDAVMNRGANVPRTFDRAAREMDRVLRKSRKTTAAGGVQREHRQIFSFLFGTLLVVLIPLFVLLLMFRGRERQRLTAGLVFLAPSLVLLTVFVLAPLVFSLYLSVHQWDIVSPEKPYVGFANFRQILSDPLFWNAMKNTALFTLQVPVGMALSLFVALLLNQRIRGVSFLRTLFFLPSVSSFVAIALVWQWLYHPQFGLANFLLGKLGLGPYPWLTDPKTALLSIMIMTVWMGIGYQSIIFLAGLQGIPEHYYEAALIDGASVWQRFRYITFPLLLPTTFFVLVTSVIGSFQVFTSVYVMTGGGPARSTDVVVYHIYQSAWEYLRMGEASAMSWILFLIILVATYLQFKALGRRVEYG